MGAPEAATSPFSQFTKRAIGYLRAARPWRSPSLVLIAAINVALIVLYLWSRGGATTRIHIETVGSEYQVYVDGQFLARTDFESTGRGAVAISLPGDHVPSVPPSLPSPSGVDSVRIEDLDTGNVILDEDFRGSISDTWSTTTGNWQAKRGVYATSELGFLTTDPYEWGNYAVDLTFKNPTIVTVRLWREAGDTVVVKIWTYQRHEGRIMVERNGKTISSPVGRGLALDRGETIRSIVAMMLRPYPWALLIIAGTIAIALALRSTRIDRQLGETGQAIIEASNGLMAVVVAGALVLLWYINYIVADAMPHVPDSVAYIFQAKIFASFHVTADPPPVPASFAFFRPPFLHIVDGRWFTQYPFGHPLFLAIGERLGAVWLVPPVLGAASLFLIYRLGAHVYGASIGLLAALLFFFSPFFQMTASNFMSHNTAVFVLLMCLFLLARPSKRRTLSMFVAGIFVGLLFNMRPLVATAFIPVLGVFMAYELWRAGEERAKVFKEDLAFAWGGAVMLLAYFAYNHATTGSFTDSPQTLTFGETSDWVGFGGRHTVTAGLQNQQVLLSLMLLVADGWPAAIGFLFAGLPFILGTRNRWDYFLGASFLSLAAANIFYTNAAVMHGPRFWYETMPFLMLLTARGAVMLKDRASAAGDWLAARLGWRPHASGAGITGLAVLGIVAGLTASSAHGWMLEQRDLWSRIDFMPQRISMLEGFNSTDRRLLDTADEMNLDNALVFVVPCRPWWCYGSVFWTNSPGLNGDIVWAQQTESQADLDLLKYYADRDLYLADYADGSIRPTSVDELEAIIGFRRAAPGAKQ